MKRLACGLLLVGIAAQWPAVAAEVDQQASPRLADERIVLRTNLGDLVLALYADIAPRHTAQITKLARLGVYDSAWFYRVEPGFVAQLTDAANRRVPLSSEQQAAISRIPAEFSKIPHKRGVVSMARQDNDINGAETSFSFLLSNAPHLDGKYTVFGHLESGADVLAAIARSPRDAKHAPVSQIVVEQALVRTAEELKEMRLVGAPQELPGTTSPIRRISPTATVGILLMMTLSIIGFMFGGRWQPRTVGSFSLLTVLVGAFVLIAEYIPGAADRPLLATVIFVGIIGLLKLLNRFESPPRSPPPDARQK